MPVSNLGRIGFVTKGDWSAGMYKYLDVVKHAAGTWICAVPTTNEEPGAGTDWQNALTAPDVTGIANWSQLSGTQSPPLIVYDDQRYWSLITTVSDITANKPSESPDVFRSDGLIDDAVTSNLTTWSSEKISSLSLINAPLITSPANGAVDFLGEITSIYTTSSSYAGTQDWVRWESSMLADFSTLVDSYEGGSNLTSWTPSIGMSLTQIFVRTKQGSDGHRSVWSDTVSFTTPNTYVEEPTLTVSGAPDFVPESPRLETSAFSVFSGSDTHLNTDWQVLDDQLQVVWESLADAANKLSIAVPAGILLESTAYTFRARHRGETYGASAWVSVVATTRDSFEYGKYLAVAHLAAPYITIYGQDVDTLDKLTDPATLPTDACWGVAFSADGVYMAVGHNTSPFITIYKRSGNTFTKLADPSTLPTREGKSVAFSADGTYMAVAHLTAPHITIYKRSGDTFTKLADPSTLPGVNARGVAFSADGTYLAVVNSSSPRITIYKRSGDTFTKLADPSILPTGTGQGVAFSADGVYMAVGHSTSPFITIYKRSGDTFTKLADPSILPTGTGNSVAFSADGTYMAVGHFTAPFITIYKRSGDTFTKLADPSTLPTGTGNSVAFSADGVYMAVGHSTSPFITIYKRSGDTFTKLADPSILPTGTGQGVAFYPRAFEGVL